MNQLSRVDSSLPNSNHAVTCGNPQVNKGKTCGFPQITAWLELGRLELTLDMASYCNMGRLGRIGEIKCKENFST